MNRRRWSIIIVVVVVAMNLCLGFVIKWAIQHSWCVEILLLQQLLMLQHTVSVGCSDPRLRGRVDLVRRRAAVSHYGLDRNLSLELRLWRWASDPRS